MMKKGVHTHFLKHYLRLFLSEKSSDLGSSSLFYSVLRIEVRDKET